RELFYRDYAGAMMAAAVTLSPEFSARPAVELFADPSHLGSGAQGGGRTYDLSLDGTRFLMIKESSPDDGAAQPLVVVLNWFEELERRAPPQQRRSALRSAGVAHPRRDAVHRDPQPVEEPWIRALRPDRPQARKQLPLHEVDRVDVG